MTPVSVPFPRLRFSIFLRTRGGRSVAAAIFSITLATATLSAQFVTPAAPVENGPNLPAQPIGANDLLSLSVYGAPEFSRTVRVSEEGRIRLPMLHGTIAVLGMMPAELETRLAQELEDAQILVDPAVTVSIAEYHSHPISVIGAVKAPLTFQAVGPTTLVEALARAQGLADDAGSEILVTRRTKAASGQAGGDDASPVTERVPVRGLIDAADPNLNLRLEGGEEVRVPTVGRVFVAGNVMHPGGFRLDEGASVLKAMALAQGLTPYAAKRAYIYRRNDGTPEEIPVELRKIMDRKSEDVPLRGNDILYIPDDRSRRTTMTAVERAVGFAVGTASGIMILGLR